jgi:hypothetical protein
LPFKSDALKLAAVLQILPACGNGLPCRRSCCTDVLPTNGDFSTSRCCWP